MGKGCWQFCSWESFPRAWSTVTRWRTMSAEGVSLSRSTLHVHASPRWRGCGSWVPRRGVGSRRTGILVHLYAVRLGRPCLPHAIFDFSLVQVAWLVSSNAGLRTLPTTTGVRWLARKSPREKDGSQVGLGRKELQGEDQTATCHGYQADSPPKYPNSLVVKRAATRAKDPWRRARREGGLAGPAGPAVDDQARHERHPL